MSKHIAKATRQEHGTRVLVVEDNLMLRFVMAEMLTDNGFLVAVAGHVVEALAIVENDPPEIVVTDVDLPGEMDGIDFAIDLKGRWPDLPVVIISGRAPLVKAFPSSCPFLPKPVSERLLLALMKRMVAGKFRSTYGQ